MGLNREAEMQMENIALLCGTIVMVGFFQEFPLALNGVDFNLPKS